MIKRYQSFASFQEFWPYYLSEHSRKSTRALHFIGTSLALASGIILALLIAAGSLPVHFMWWFFAVPLCGYGFAWIAHFFVEKNKPATFQHPIYSLLGDLKMFFLMLTGRLRV